MTGIDPRPGANVLVGGGMVGPQRQADVVLLTKYVWLHAG
ncbi:hypothetical protein FHR72_004112 [Mycolicibacterium iranicum]|uniref:Uncharacterized protein n=1 Tax=Mycolicibacterium iranicum TaxID=912594 RepID=A0A839QK33_MYCIR|nr:hypothetical protein [Mycolicibacterium iranicum]